VRAGHNAEKIDLVITLGGDGTILHASSLFKVGAVPPVLSFSMGTLASYFRSVRLFTRSCAARHRDSLSDVDDFAKAMESVFQGQATVLYRMRLSCTFHNKDGKKIGNDGEGPYTIFGCVAFEFKSVLGRLAGHE